MPCALLSVLLAGSVAACGGDSGAEGTSATSSSAATTSSAGTASSTSPGTGVSEEADVTVPPAARKHTEKGAEEFVRFFSEDVLAIAWTGPKSHLVSEFSAPACRTCSAMEAEAVRMVDEGSRYKSEPVSVRYVGAFEGAPDGMQAVRLLLDQHHVQVVDQEGEALRSQPRKRLAYDAIVQWAGGQWRIYEIG
jgi:hypothetical protein